MRVVSLIALPYWLGVLLCQIYQGLSYQALQLWAAADRAIASAMSVAVLC